VRSAAALPKSYSKIGDDVAVIPAGVGKVVLKTDMLVQRTDVPKQMTFRQAARKSVAMCVSDFAAKGVKPDSFMVSLGLERGVTKSEVRELSLGLRDASKEWNLKLIGGDTSEAAELSINCAMVGFARRFTKREGAAPGDVVAVSGRFGYPPSGLRILQGGAKTTPSFRKKAVGSVLTPTPNLGLGLALADFWTSAMDSSDGLARSLHVLSKASKVGIDVWKRPAGQDVKEFAAKNGFAVDKLVLEGGEEYLIVGTMKPSRVRSAARIASANGGELLVIGKVTHRRGGVSIHVGSGVKPMPDSGWVHLR
jgi:thiamine-monophosphate kinase